MKETLSRREANLPVHTHTCLRLQLMSDTEAQVSAIDQRTSEQLEAAQKEAARKLEVARQELLLSMATTKESIITALVSMQVRCGGR